MFVADVLFTKRTLFAFVVAHWKQSHPSFCSKHAKPSVRLFVISWEWLPPVFPCVVLLQVWALDPIASFHYHLGYLLELQILWPYFRCTMIKNSGLGPNELLSQTSRWLWRVLKFKNQFHGELYLFNSYFALYYILYKSLSLLITTHISLTWAH